MVGSLDVVTRAEQAKAKEVLARTFSHSKLLEKLFSVNTKVTQGPRCCL
jgi:BMFP domain-containing protein YqiC